MPWRWSTRQWLVQGTRRATRARWRRSFTNVVCRRVRCARRARTHSRSAHRPARARAQRARRVALSTPIAADATPLVRGITCRGAHVTLPRLPELGPLHPGPAPGGANCPDRPPRVACCTGRVHRALRALTQCRKVPAPKVQRWSTTPPCLLLKARAHGGCAELCTRSCVTETSLLRAFARRRRRR